MEIWTGIAPWATLMLLLMAVYMVDCVSLDLDVTSDRGTRRLVTGSKYFQVRPHSDMKFSCFVSGMESNMILQIVKVDIRLKKHTGEEDIYKPISWPYVMAVGDKLDELLLETGRYTVFLEAEEGSMEMLVSSALQDDSGLWACRILKNGQEYLISEVEIKIFGPIQGIDLRQAEFAAQNGTFHSGAILTTIEGTIEPISCTIFFTNWLPEVDISIRDANMDNYRNLTGLFQVAYPPETLYFMGFSLGSHTSPLRKYFGQVTYKMAEFKFSNRDHKKRLYCTAIGGHLFKPKHVYLDLDVKFKPTDGECSRVESDGANLHMTCSFRANPEPNLTWQNPDKIDLSDTHIPVSISVGISEDRHSSTLTLEGFNTSYLGIYTLIASNSLGEQSITLDLSPRVLQSVAGSASFITVRIIHYVVFLISSTQICL